jgi:hypothetical protein
VDLPDGDDGRVRTSQSDNGSTDEISARIAERTFHSAGDAGTGGQSEIGQASGEVMRGIGEKTDGGGFSGEEIGQFFDGSGVHGSLSWNDAGASGIKFVQRQQCLLWYKDMTGKGECDTWRKRSF